MMNIILIIGILLGVILFFRYIIRKIPDNIEESEEHIYEIDYLATGVDEGFDEKQNINLNRLGLNEREIAKRREERKNLKHSLRTCAQGDKPARDYVIDEIKAMLQKKFNITPDTICNVIPFDKVEQLTARDKFDILLYVYTFTYKYNGSAFEEIIRKYNLDRKRDSAEENSKYEIDENDINQIYEAENIETDFMTRMEIVAQRVFAAKKGNGVIDSLIFQNLDSVSSGVSGLSTDMRMYWEQEDASNLKYVYDSIYIMYRGKPIHLSFLTYETERELIRVSKNVYKYKSPGQLSQDRGYLINHLKTGARVSIMRPEFGSSWAFWIRMFDSMQSTDIRELCPQKGNEILNLILKFIVKGERSLMVCGGQASGKTKLLIALVNFVRDYYSIRTIEQDFELMLNKIYGVRKNIAGVREHINMTMDQIIAFLKKAEADLIIFGEVGKEEDAADFIKGTQSGTRFTMSTNHGIDVDKTIAWLRNALLKMASYSNEKAAEIQAVEAIPFYIHMFPNFSSGRGVYQITEVIPDDDEGSVPEDPMQAIQYYIKYAMRKHFYKKNVILEFSNGEYRIVNPISSSRCAQIMLKLDEQEQIQFMNLFNIDENYIYGEGKKAN